MKRPDWHPAFHHRAPSLARYILAALLIPLVLASLAFWLEGETRESENFRLQARASMQRQLLLRTVISRLRDAETAQRGYVLTGAGDFLTPYGPAKREVMDALAVPLLTRDATSTRAVIQLRQLAMHKFDDMERAISRRHRRGPATIVGPIEDRRGDLTIDRMRSIVGSMVRREGQTGAAQVARYSDRVAATRGALRMAILVISITLLLGVLVLWRNRKQRYAAHVAAFEAAQRSRTILDSTIDALVILNPSGTIETINAAATTMLGYAADELERRDITILIDIAPGRGSFHDRIGLANGHLRSALTVDRLIRHKDGRLIPVDIAMGVMMLASGEHIVMSLRDISERKRIERVKDDLVSTVSHELRTPLTSVIGALGLLRAGTGGELKGNAVRLVEIAENNSRRLIRLINDMLDIDSIESGKLQLMRAEIDLRDVADRACEGSLGLAASGDVTIECHTPDDPVLVLGDADRLLQVITNLASNAIHVSKRGSVVNISVASSSSSKALVCVDDDGPGVPPAFRDRIFGRFERAEYPDGVAGTGLGLAISREIVTRHDGRIWFEDRQGGGTRFAFEMDLVRHDALDTGHAGRVLVATWDPDLARKAASLASIEGYDSDIVMSDAEVHEAIGRHAYAALIVDLDLPAGGGLALARSLRANDEQPVVPIILLSVDIDDRRAIPLDRVDWIDHPVDPARLAAALTAALGRSDARRPVILHVDDDPDVLEITASALRPSARLMRAGTLAGARSVLASITPDVVILDVDLADGHGLDLLPELVDRNGRPIPTIIYSAQDVPADKAGRVDAVLVKARGSLPDLRSTVSRLLAREAEPA